MTKDRDFESMVADIMSLRKIIQDHVEVEVEHIPDTPTTPPDLQDDSLGGNP